MNHKVGDLVMCDGDLGQVSKKIKDVFGYSVYWFKENQTSNGFDKEDIEDFKRELEEFNQI